MDTIIGFLQGFWEIMGEMSPYLLLGFLIAGILSVFFTEKTVEKYIGRRDTASVFKASLFGVPLPLCSCGVIPVGMSLRRHGAGRGAATAFLISTPQTGVDSILVTFSLLGPLFAIVRPIAALVTGAAGGMLVNGFVGKEKTTAATANTQPGCTGGCCGRDEGTETSESRFERALRYGFLTLPGDIGKYLIVGLVLAAVVSALIPADYLSSYLGRGLVPMFAMMLIGIPMYVCSTASVPVAAALMAAGVSPGAALVFLMTGPATNIATITTIWSVLGKRTALIYLGTIAVGAMLSGLLLDALAVNVAQHLNTTNILMLPAWVGNLSAVLLIGVIATALMKRKGQAHMPVTEAMAESVSENIAVYLEIKGMKCSHCVNQITRSLNELSKVSGVDIDLQTGQSTITGRNLDREELIGIVTSLGYGIEE